MCGIAGYIGPAEIGEGRIRACLDTMRRRGPDHAAYRSFRTPDGRNVLLLHTRLSIIDLDPRANQPFRVGGMWLAYNGELYNYVELRRELAGEGAAFETTSDTEVLLRWLDRRGLAGIDRCEGRR